VLPASSRLTSQARKGAGMRIIGLDIHRAFAEAVAWNDRKLRRLGRVNMRRDLLGAFAATLSGNDVVVIETTGNAAAVATIIAPHVKKVEKWLGDGRDPVASEVAATTRRLPCVPSPMSAVCFMAWATLSGSRRCRAWLSLPFR
jgi:hypothetical protein